MDLIPVVTKVLNRLDATLTVINELSSNLQLAHEENSSLKQIFRFGKKVRQMDFEASLHFEESAESESVKLCNFRTF